MAKPSLDDVSCRLRTRAGAGAGRCVDGGSLRVLGTGALGALLVAFVLQGLSVVHAAAASRKMSWLLSLTYTALIVLGTIATPLLALLGVGEALFHLRRRVMPVPAALPPGSL